MPYIPRENRPQFTQHLERLPYLDMTKGDLTFCVYYIARRWLRSHVKPGYVLRSSAVSSLADASAELRRRELDPHEDQKREYNGDV